MSDNGQSQSYNAIWRKILDVESSLKAQEMRDAEQDARYAKASNHIYSSIEGLRHQIEGVMAAIKSLSSHQREHEMPPSRHANRIRLIKEFARRSIDGASGPQ